MQNFCSTGVKACRISAALNVKPCRISASLDAIPCRISAALDVKACKIFARLGRQTLQNFCITVLDTMSNKNEKKNRLNILRVKIKDFIVPFLNVQSIMCTLTRFNKQRSKKMNICTSKLYLRLTFR